MKYLIVFTIAFLSLLSHTLADNSKGVSVDLNNVPQKLKTGDKSCLLKNVRSTDEPVQEQKAPNLLFDSSWKVIDSSLVKTYVLPQTSMGATLQSYRRKLTIEGQRDFGDKAIAAIDKAPAWLRLDLSNTLSLVNESKQNELADIILDAQDPIVDEICFVIAHISPDFLISSLCFPQLFVENAQLLYDNDQFLDYVEIVDYGSSTEDDYYSTTRYWKIDSSGNKYQVEVPRDIYYWYIVHPKLSDDIPTYIDPLQSESNHQGNIAAPPVGRFWREFLFTFTEEVPDTTGVMFPILKEQMLDCQVLWDNRDSVKGAVKTMSQWIVDVMNFTSKDERPHQPIRIYKLHIGRCGEHEDITNATSRTCLVPCRGIATLSTDHVWNEFWDERWEQWERKGWKNKMRYSGRKYGTVFARRSDGVLIYVTDEYERTCSVATINLTLKDQNHNPVDGAIAYLYVNHLDSVQYPNSVLFDSYAVTDNNGQCQFIVGPERKFYCRIVNKWGSYPPEQGVVAGMVMYPDSGKTYDLEASMSYGQKALPCTDIYMPEDDIDDYVVQADFGQITQAVKWTNAIDDFQGYYTYQKKPGGRLQLLFAEQEQYMQFCSHQKFFATPVDYLGGANQGNNMVNIPRDSRDFTLFMVNSDCQVNSAILDGCFKLYASPEFGIDEDQFSINATDIKIFPNPFNDNISVQLNMDKPQSLKYEISDCLGNIVMAGSETMLNPGTHTITWKGFDMAGRPAASGMYFIRIIIGHEQMCKTIIKM